MTATELEDALLAWFGPAAGELVIWEYLNAPRPTNTQTWTSLHPPRLVRETEPVETLGPLSDDGLSRTRDVSLSWMLWLNVTAHGLRAYDRAWALQQKLYDALPGIFAPAVFIEAEPVMNLPQRLGPDYEERAEFVARFRVTTTTSTTVPILRAVGLSSCFTLGKH